MTPVYDGSGDVWFGLVWRCFVIIITDDIDAVFFRWVQTSVPVSAYGLQKWYSPFFRGLVLPPFFRGVVLPPFLGGWYSPLF